MCSSSAMAQSSGVSINTRAGPERRRGSAAPSQAPCNSATQLCELHCSCTASALSRGCSRRHFLSPLLALPADSLRPNPVLASTGSILGDSAQAVVASTAYAGCRMVRGHAKQQAADLCMRLAADPVVRVCSVVYVAVAVLLRFV